MKPTFFIKTTLLALSVALFAPLASASSVFDIVINGSDAAGDHFSVTLVAKAGSDPDVYDIMGGYGTVTRVVPGTVPVDSSASAFAGPWDINNLANSPSGFYNYDDIFYGGSGNADGNPFDHTGLLLILRGPSHQEVNIYCHTGTQDCFFSENDGYGDSPLTSFSSSVGPAPTVPEPGSLVLFGTGILGFAGTVRRRFKA